MNRQEIFRLSKKDVETALLEYLDRAGFRNLRKPQFHFDGTTDIYGSSRPNGKIDITVEIK